MVEVEVVMGGNAVGVAVEVWVSMGYCGFGEDGKVVSGVESVMVRTLYVCVCVCVCVCYGEKEKEGRRKTYAYTEFFPHNRNT